MNRQLIASAIFLAIAGVIWLVFLRPVPVRTTNGIVRSKQFKPEGQYVQYPVGDRPGFRGPTTVHLAEHFVLDIEVDGESSPFRYAVNTAAAAAFDIGQRVNVEYQTRGLPPFWRRVYVLNAQPTN